MPTLAMRPLASLSSRSSIVVISGCWRRNSCNASGSLPEDETPPSDRRYYKLGKYEDAQHIYSAIIGLRDKDTDAYYLRACTLLKEGNYESALADFEKAFSLATDNLELVTSAYEEMQAIQSDSILIRKREIIFTI